MKLATGLVAGREQTIVVDDDLSGRAFDADIVDLLTGDRRPAPADGRDVDVAATRLLPVVPRPEKFICVGLNYRTHILEMGRELPSYPTLFAKFGRALIGARDPIVLPAESSLMDWEAELGVVIGRPVRRASPEQARAAIGGYTVVNDVSARDWQGRTSEWLQGKSWEATTPVGPWLALAESVDPGRTGAPDLEVRCTVNGEVVQRARTSDLVFSPWELVAYVSTLVTLVPGDIIATGTPAGVGAAMRPPRSLHPGDVVVTEIEGIGACSNECVAA